jgi:excisionase family DNA binding protein
MDYMTVTQAARELGLSVYGIRARIERGEIRAEKVSPRLLMIHREEIERWRGKGKLKPGPKPRRRLQEEG